MAGSWPADSQLQLRFRGWSGARKRPRFNWTEEVMMASKVRLTRRRERMLRRILALERVFCDRGSSLSRGSRSWPSRGTRISSSSSGVASTLSDGVSIGMSMVVLWLRYCGKKRKMWYGNTYAGSITTPGLPIQECSKKTKPPDTPSHLIHRQCLWLNDIGF